MASAGAERPRLDPVAYRDALREAFPDYGYADGAMHAWRFNLFERLVGEQGLPPNAALLNVGCGPFALEVHSRIVRGCRVTSFDYTAEFAHVYDKLKSERMLEDVSFFVGDIRTVSFPAESFDIIVFHDVFYEAALDAPEIVARFVPFLKRRGLVYLDLMNRSAGGLWRLMGSERKEYRRYDVPAALSRIKAAGLEQIACCPTDENRVGWKRRALTGIRLLTGKANSFGVLARRAG